MLNRHVNRQIHLDKIKNKYQMLGKYIYILRAYMGRENIWVSSKNLRDPTCDVKDPVYGVYTHYRNDLFEIKSPHTLDKYLAQLKDNKLKVYFVDEAQEFTFEEYRKYCLITQLCGLNL